MHKSHRQGRIVLGLGGTVDYEIVLDRLVLESLIIEWEVNDAEIVENIFIDSERNLLLTLLYFIKTGTGGEKFVSNSQDLINFSSRFNKEVTLGGTCVRAAIALSYFNIKSTVHLVSTSIEVRERIPESVETICSADHDTLDPHLIVQFGENYEITARDVTLRSHQPSRIIYTNDPPNRDLVISEELSTVLKDASVFMISGFNCIQDRTVLDQRIADIKRHLKSAPKDCKVFFEDAGYHVLGMSQEVQKQLIECMDIYSLNEDEMKGYIGRDLDLLDVNDVFEGLTGLRKQIPAKNLVVHTRFWSIVIGPESEELVSSLQAGVDMASTRYMNGDVFTPSDFEAISHLPKSQAGSVFASGIQALFSGTARCIPGYELKATNPTTIGLGDVFVGGFVGALSGQL